MKDILLTPDGDLHVSETGDICITDSVRKAAQIRLQWFLGEWRFAPAFGVPYYEDILIKKLNITRIRSIVRNEVMSVAEVKDVSNIAIDINAPARKAAIALDIVTAEDSYREEVLIYG